MRLDGRKAIVTGGSAGIGLALTEQLVKAGADVVICGRNEKRLAAVQERLGDRVDAIRADMANADDIASFCDHIQRHHPDASILVNNAGIQQQLSFFQPDNSSADRIRLEVDCNLTAVMVLCERLIPLLGRHDEALIANISSALALSPKRSAPVYCAAKAALRSFTKTLRYQSEAAASTVRVADVVMALVDTDMTAGRGRRKISPDQAAREIISGIERGSAEIWIGATKALRIIHRVSPAMADRMLRDG